MAKYIRIATRCLKAKVVYPDTPGATKVGVEQRCLHKHVVAIVELTAIVRLRERGGGEGRGGEGVSAGCALPPPLHFPLTHQSHNNALLSINACNISLASITLNAIADIFYDSEANRDANFEYTVYAALTLDGRDILGG